jgi:hypothetical protein
MGPPQSTSDLLDSFPWSDLELVAAGTAGPRLQSATARDQNL